VGAHITLEPTQGRHIVGTQNHRNSGVGKFMSKRIGGLAAALCLAPVVSAAADTAAKPQPQYVLISFDGAHDNKLWDRSLKLADETGSRFTYFLSCVYLLGPEHKRLYHPPGMKAGRSNVGFAPSHDDAAERLGHVWAAYQAGHEIASHGCGHFDGKDWSKADWTSEFDQFDDILARGWEINGLPAPAGWAEMAKHGIRGFRAPYLSQGKALAATLAERGYEFNASAVTKGPQLPERHGKLAEFGLPMIPEGPSERRIISMDYNLFVRHSGAKERPDEADAFAERTYEAFAHAFEAEYHGERRPVQMGFHFVLMNGGAYWTALERFAREFCVKADVKCVGYSDWLRANPNSERAVTAGG
jgi:peptidoglycan/xylan/chitin deacetylase (PgdA/CDA1 family)